MSHDLRLERIIDATPEEVFDAFTDPEAHKEWYQDRPEDVVTSEVDLRVGGTWDTAFGHAGEAPYREINVFTEIERPHLLVYSSTFVNPDGSRFDTDLVVRFEEEAGKTRLTIEQSGFPTEKDRNDHQGGWPGFIDRLERVVAVRRAT